MKKGRLKEIVSELQGASKMHLKQSKEIEKHIEDMKAPTKQVEASDVVGFAGNFIKGIGGTMMTMLSPTAAAGGQESKSEQQKKFLDIPNDGGPLPFPKTKPEETEGVKSVAKARYKCWKGYKAKGKKKSPSGKRTKSGKIKMVNNCVKK